MKAANADILIVPGLGNSPESHWQSRWEAKLSTARRVDLPNWDEPVPAEWIEAILAAIAASEKPVVLVGHSLGVIACVHAAARLGDAGLSGKVRAGFFVAPADPGRAGAPASVARFAPVLEDPLPFASIVVASRDDPHCAFSIAEERAHAWGSLFIDAGEIGHINVASGHGPWPEGSLTFAKFLSSLPEC